MAVNLLENKPLIEQYLKEANKPLSVFSFVSIFAWSDFFEFDLKVIHQNLCIFAKDKLGCFLYLPPLGKDVHQETIEECFKMMESLNGKGGITRIENISEDILKLLPEEKFSLYRKGYEYCYYREDIVSLKGNPYKSKRSSYNHFIKNNSYQYVPFAEIMLKECVALYDSWAQKRKGVYLDPVYNQMLEDSRKVYELLLRHYKDLGLIARIVYIKNKIKACAVGYSITEDIFCILFEITDLDLNGLSVFIFKSFCEDESLCQYKFINVMDDFELKNIERVKMSFHPSVLLPLYVVKKKGSA